MHETRYLVSGTTLTISSYCEEWQVQWLHTDPSMRSQASNSAVNSYAVVTRSQNKPVTYAFMILGAYIATAQTFGLWNESKAHIQNRLVVDLQIDRRDVSGVGLLFLVPRKFLVVLVSCLGGSCDKALQMGDFLHRGCKAAGRAY